MYYIALMLTRLCSLKDVIFESDLNVGAEYVIYSGDWNVTINSDLDSRNYLHVNNTKAWEVIKNRMVSDGLVDVWRLNNPILKNFTWFQVGSGKRARLDYFLTSPNVTDITLGVGMEPADNLSDHGATWIELGQIEKKQGRGFWRFNNLFLSDPKFLESTNSVISNFFRIFCYNSNACR